MEMGFVCSGVHYCPCMGGVLCNLSDRGAVWMSNWQNWAVALILLLCIVRIGQRVYAFFMKVREKRNPCENCATGCELKQLYEKKRSECSDGKKEIKKKCC